MFRQLFVFLYAATLTAQPVAVDDMALEEALIKGIAAFTKDDKVPSAKELATSLEKAPKTLAQPLPNPEKTTKNPEASVYVIGFIYDCGKCDKWHLGGTASAWALSEDGIMVTNHHVINEADGETLGVCDKDGNVHRVVEILAADQENDIAIFRVNTQGLKPLCIGTPAAIGDEVKVISHPDGLYYTHTFGRVSRYHRSEQVTHMSITADFALGSSGAPILDTENRVIGMVASTYHIYYDAEAEKDMQMVVKDCVPVSAIAAMLATKEQ